jgi:hypothetical protein
MDGTTAKGGSPVTLEGSPPNSHRRASPFQAAPRAGMHGNGEVWRAEPLRARTLGLARLFEGGTR